MILGDGSLLFGDESAIRYQREVNVTKRPSFNEECLHVPITEKVTGGERDGYEEERIEE